MEQTNYSAPVQPAPVYAQSCLSAAWADIKATPGYVGRLVVLGLIMCVPILNFVVAGYLLFWSREVPFGGRTPLPQKMVTGKNFEFGFYAFVITLVVGIVGGIAGGIVGWIPLLGWIVAIAISLAVYVAAFIMQMRMIMGLALGAGFGLKDIWEKAKRNWGQLLLVSLVPIVAVGAIICVLAFLVVFLCLFAGLGGAMPTLMTMGGTSDPSFAQVMSLIGAIAVPTIIGTLIVYVVGSILETFAEALTLRGLGHWVARYAPEWTGIAVPRY